MYQKSIFDIVVNELMIWNVLLAIRLDSVGHYQFTDAWAAAMKIYSGVCDCQTKWSRKKHVKSRNSCSCMVQSEDKLTGKYGKNIL